VTPAERSFAEQLERTAGVEWRPAGEPNFVCTLRAQGREAFLRAKLPTPKHEDWRYTSLAALAAQPFAPAPRARAWAGSTRELPAAPRLVFVNGRLDPDATDLTRLPAGVRMGSLGTALRERPAAVQPHLGQVAAPGAHAFTALNAGLFEDGAVVEIEDGVSCAPTLHLVFLDSGACVAAHPRNLILAGRHARAAIVESYRGEGSYLVNAVTELSLGEGAHVEHDRLQEDAPHAFHVGVVQVAQAARSSFTGQSIALGGELARVEARVLLGGEGATCDLHGLYVATGKQVLDHLVYVDHASPRCVSREVFKGVLDGASRGVFAGRVHVREGARKTDASQVNSNLLLSEDATVDTKPQLEILNDDVKCSHGGTVGQIREDQLFYLRSRGLSEALARAMLTWAFASEMVRMVGPEEARARVQRAVTARLPHGALLRHDSLLSEPALGGLWGSGARSPQAEVERSSTGSDLGSPEPAAASTRNGEGAPTEVA
jgi:Fe-S cluster assembly protein SufD